MEVLIISPLFGIVINEMWNHSKMLLAGERPLAGYVQNARRLVPLHQTYNEQAGLPVAYWNEFYVSVYQFEESHFTEIQVHDKFVGSPFASTVYYANRYPDLGRSQSEPLVHMFTVGLQEGRQLSPHFDPKFYIDKYPDLQNAFGQIENPKDRNLALLCHYVRFGCEEGRTASADYCARGYLKRYSEIADQVKQNYKQGLIHFYKYGHGAGLSAAPWNDE